VPSGYELTAMVLGDYDSLNPVAFVGFQRGPRFVGDYLIPQSYLGYTHMSFSQFEQDLLPIMADPTVAVDAQGFTIPLASDTYTFFMQQFDEDTLYRFEFEVAPVPGPGVGALGVVGVGAAGMRRRRRGAES